MSYTPRHAKPAATKHATPSSHRGVVAATVTAPARGRHARASVKREALAISATAALPGLDAR